MARKKKSTKKSKVITLSAPDGWKASAYRKLPSLPNAVKIERWQILVSIHDRTLFDDIYTLIKQKINYNIEVEFTPMPKDKSPLIRIGIQPYISKSGEKEIALFVMYNK